MIIVRETLSRRMIWNRPVPVGQFSWFGGKNGVLFGAEIRREPVFVRQATMERIDTRCWNVSCERAEYVLRTSCGSVYLSYCWRDGPNQTLRILPLEQRIWPVVRGCL
jgi:hypothetical protein